MIITVLKIPLKIIAVPVMVLMTLIQWIGVFITSISSVILNILAGLFFLCGVLAYLMGISTGHEALRMVIAGFVIFILPVVMEVIVAGIAALNGILRHFIRS